MRKAKNKQWCNTTFTWHHFNLTYYFASFLFSLNQTLNSNSGCWKTASELPHCTRSGMPHVSISAALDAQLPGSMGGSTTLAHRMVRTKCLLLNWHIHSGRSVWFFLRWHIFSMCFISSVRKHQVEFWQRAVLTVSVKSRRLTVTNHKVKLEGKKEEPRFIS